MDDRRFDALVKALATGTNRRSLVKGLLGLGGATVVGSSLRESAVDAARRPTPTPKPITCPGRQTWNGTACVCPGSAPDKCGPDCCNAAADGPTHSECCDNACCFGLCYGEELCCPTGRTFCEATGECCPADQPYCCGASGCCASPCCETAAGSTCCEGNTPKCCPEDICIAAGGCCDVTDCGAGNCWSCIDRVCVSDQAKCSGCTDCVGGTCAPNDQNCADADPCTRSTCNTDGTCTAQVFDCRLDSCTCTPSDACQVASCNQETGQCSEVETCSVECCASLNPDEGCYLNPRCEFGNPPGTVYYNGPCVYDIFCADVCCASAYGGNYSCQESGTCRED